MILCDLHIFREKWGKGETGTRYVVCWLLWFYVVVQCVFLGFDDLLDIVRDGLRSALSLHCLVQDEGDNCLDCWGFMILCLGLVLYSHNSCFIISISYHFCFFLSFQFDLMFDTLFMPFDLIFVYDASTHGTFSVQCVSVFSSVVCSFFLWWYCMAYCLNLSLCFSLYRCFASKQILHCLHSSL